MFRVTGAPNGVRNALRSRILTKFVSSALVLHSEMADRYDVVGVQASSSDGSHTEILWGDGHKSSFNNLWLRDHCRCPECLNSNTSQRSFDSLQLGAYVDTHATANLCQVDTRGKSRPRPDNCDLPSVLKLNMKTQEGECHTVQFSKLWLRDNCYSGDARVERASSRSKHRTIPPSWDPVSLSEMCVWGSTLVLVRAPLGNEFRRWTSQSLADTMFVIICSSMASRL